MIARTAFGTFLAERGLDASFGEPLAPYTTLKIGGPADYFVRPGTPDELRAAVEAARDADLPVRLLGSGANLLVGDGGVRGLVIHLGRMRRREGLHVEAGYNLAKLVRETVDAGLGGLEALAGVPACVGGAVAMNAGGRHGDISGAIRYVDVLTPAGSPRRLDRRDIPFRYRSWGLDSHVVLAAGFDLRPDPDARRRCDEILAAKKASQPLGTHNAGCVFKNPPGAGAGRMIDECGLKGARVGGATVSRKHANFIVNEGGGTATDVRILIDLVRDRVRARFGTELELEILLW